MTAGEPAAGFAARTALGMLVQLAVTDPAATAPARELLEADLHALAASGADHGVGPPVQVPRQLRSGQPAFRGG
jgi:hypothetical protein